MNSQFNFRAFLIKIQDLLSEEDRQYLHFLVGEDVPRYLRDDLSLSGTLRLFDSLLEKEFISDQDCNYFIEAFNKIGCYDSPRRLQEYQRTREHDNQRSLSLQDILFKDNEKDKLSTNGIMPTIIDSTLTLDPSASLTDAKFTKNRSASLPSVHNRMEENIQRSRPMDLIYKMPLNTRLYFLLILLIITILALLISLIVVIKLCGKPVQSNTTTPPGWAYADVTFFGNSSLSTEALEKLLDSKAREKNKHLDWRKSVVDLMKLLNLDSSQDRRIQLARKLGFKGDMGDSYKRNDWLRKQLLEILTNNNGTLPAEFKEWEVVSAVRLSM